MHFTIEYKIGWLKKDKRSFNYNKFKIKIDDSHVMVYSIKDEKLVFVIPSDKLVRIHT